MQNSHVYESAKNILSLSTPGVQNLQKHLPSTSDKQQTLRIRYK